MKKFKKSAWYQEHIQSKLDQYGLFPPPWVYKADFKPSNPVSPDEKLYDALFQTWWYKQSFTEQQKIDYLKVFPITEAWYDWAILQLWSNELAYDDECLFYETYDEQLYFERIVKLGIVKD